MSFTPIPAPGPGPIHINVNGIGQLSVSRKPSRHAPAVPVQPNTEQFASIAVAVNLGLEMLETPAGRRDLTRLGAHAIQNATADNLPHRFNGRIQDMNQYVDQFLSRIRTDFPYVFVEDDYDNPTALAWTQKAPWNGNLGSFRPKALGSLGLNPERVDAMCRAHDAYARSPAGSPDRARYGRRWQHFLFMFACATLHEMAHFFICYLFRGNFPNTPPGTTYLDYAQEPGGESGRWLESQLFGGALEYMTDSQQGPDQAGIPFLTKANRRHYRISEDAVIGFVEDPRRYAFPFPTIGHGMTTAEQTQQGLRILGGTAGAPPPMPANARAMQAMAAAATFPRYNIGIRDLRRRRRQRDALITVVRAS